MSASSLVLPKIRTPMVEENKEFIRTVPRYDSTRNLNSVKSTSLPKIELQHQELKEANQPKENKVSANSHNRLLDISNISILMVALSSLDKLVKLDEIIKNNKRDKTVLRQKILVQQFIKMQIPLLKEQAIKNLKGNVDLALPMIDAVCTMIKLSRDLSFAEEELAIKIRLLYLKKYPDLEICKSTQNNIKDFIEKHSTEIDPIKLASMVQIVTSFLKLDSENTVMLNNLGMLLARQENFSKAIEIFQRTLESDSRDMFALNSCASIYLMQKNANEAMKYIQKGLACSPKDKMMLRMHKEAIALLNGI